MVVEIISEQQINNRNYWIEEISKLSGDFGADSEKVEQEINGEIESKGIDTLFGHLRLCGVIPEKYKHDSSEEKLYSKYTDIIISKAFESLGLTSCVLTERADAADVECCSGNYSFVADAKAFRLSRTAKNQKDFKVSAMNNWKKGKPFAMVVSPIYQLPNRTSQIYYQACNDSVCVFSYTHLLVLVRYAVLISKMKATQLLHKIFKTIDTLNPSKDAVSYWREVNSVILDFDSRLRPIWLEEKKATDKAIKLAKDEALCYFASERERVMKLSREDAIKVIIRLSKIENKIKKVKAVTYNGLLFME